jgi:glycosyltransferase involved in cell wall biosynthesis
MTAEPLVSVIVPTFNRPRELAGCLDSLAAQTWRTFEVRVVNDAGHPVEDVVDRYRDRLDLHLAVHPENRGLAATRNTGLCAARGAWIAYLDDDDRYLPHHLSTLVPALQRAGARVGYADSLRVEVEPDGAGGLRELRRLPVCIPFDRSRLILDNYLPVQAVVHARDCLDQVGLFDESLRHREDWELWMRFCAHWDFLRVPEVTSEYVWKVSGPSLSNDTAAQLHAVRTYLYTKHAALLPACIDDWESRLLRQEREIARLRQPSADGLLRRLQRALFPPR